MCDQTQVNHYKQGDVVWAKLGHLWWPGEVTDKTNVPEDILKPLKREPAAFVKFFNEEYFECVKEIDHMDHYNCERKNDFIKKGLGPKNPQLDKFRCDIVIAEDKLGGNVNILNEPIFVVEAKSAPEQTPKFKKQGKKSNKFVPHITHRRFLGHDDYESHILIQDVEEESKGPNEDGSLALLFKEYIENETYFCPLCNYKSSRMGVIRLHTEYHKEQTMELQTKKTQKSPEKKKVKKIYDPKDKGTKRKKKTDKSLEFVASDEEIVTPKRKRKTKGEVKETPPVVPKEDTRNTTLDLINDWSDEETSDLDTPMKKIEDAEPLATKLESPSKESTEIKKTDKSCFEFDDDIDSHIITTPSTGRKIPRVIPPSEKRKSTAAQEEPLDDGLTSEERKKRKAILDESEEFTAKTKKNTREEDIDRAYRELLESTAAPALPEVTKLVDEREQNFHCAKTKKVPDKTDKTDKSEKVNEEVGPSELKSDRESSVESNVDVNLSKNEPKSSKAEPKLEQSTSELRTSKRARKPSYKALNDEAKWQRDEQKLLKDVLKKTTDTKSDEIKPKEPPKTPKVHHYPKTAEDELLSPVSNWDEAPKSEPKSPTKKSFLGDNQDTGSILHEAKGFVSPPKKSPVKTEAKSPKKESIPENFPDKFFSTDYDIISKSPPKPAEIPETSGAKPEESAINSETLIHTEKTSAQREKSPAKREKSPVKTEKSPVKSPLKREKSPEKPKPEIEKAQEVATKLTNPKKRFVKSFEDFELMQNEQKKQAEQQENKVLNSEIIFRPEKKQKMDTAGQEPNQNVAVYKLKSQIMSKINEESNKNQILGNSPKSSNQSSKSPIRRPSIESRRFSLVQKPEPKKEIPTAIKDVVKNLQQRSPNLKIHTINQTSSKAPISSYSKYKKTLTKEFDLKHGDQSKKIVIGPSSSKGFTTAKVISISKSKLSEENVITEMLEPEEVKEPIIPPRLEEPELVEIDGTIAVVSEKDLDNAQVEITTAPPQNSNPVTIMNFSMDFSENSQEGIDFKLKNIETKTLETKLSLESIQQKNKSPKSNVFSMKSQESELVVNSEDIDNKIEPVAEVPVQEISPHEEIVEETIQPPEPEQEIPLLNQTIEEPKTENDIQFVFDDSPEKVFEKPEEKTETPIQIPVQIQKVTTPVEPTVNVLDFVDLEDQIPSQIVVANKKPKEMMDLEQEIQPLQINKQDPKNVKKVDQPYGLLHNTRFKGMKKVVTKTYEAASKKPPLKNNKAIILSEKIIKPANSLSTTPPFKKVDPAVIKKSEPQTKIMFNSDGKSYSPFRPKMLQKVITPLQKLASSGGKAKILNQTIITPSGEILQPKVSPQTTQAQAQTLQTADDVDFDINSMPIVLSDELLTPESIEAMPIVLNETLQTPKGSMHIKTAPKSTPQPPKILNKVYSTPKTAYSPSLLQHGRKIPKILQNSAQKFVKYSTSQATATPTGSKYIIVPTQTQTKVVSAPVTPQATMAKKSQFRRVPTATTSSVPLETGGNKVMIVTNQHGQQQRLLLTPDQQKLFGMDSKTPTRIVKSLPLQAQQKFIRPQQQLVQMARSAGVSPKFSPKMISPQTQTQMQVKGPLQKVKRLINQKITSKTGAPSPQKTILIKNQRGELVSRIQGTDDALLDKQVQEQLEAIKAGTLNLQKQQAAKAQAASSVGHKARSTPVKRIEHKAPPVKVAPPQPKVENKVPPLTPIKAEMPKLKEAEVVVEAEAKKEETDVGKKEEPPTDRPLNQLVIQDNQGNQTTITEGQILALPSETVDGQPQSYMLVTLDETGNITPLNNEALMSLDPNLVGDLSNMVLQIDQNAVNITQPAASAAAAEVPEAAVVEEPKKEEVVPEPQPEPEPEVVPEMTTANVHISYNMHSELGQQLMITGDPAVTQKLLDTLSEGNTDLATLLAGAEGSSSFIIQADGQQILINTETDSSMIPSVSTENEGNPVFATPNKNDILAAALADTDVLQQETQNKGIPSQLSPGNLYQINVGNVLETSLTLNSPIMTPLEVPSTNTKKIDDEADVLTQGPTKNVDLPITVTDPTIAHTVSQQQAALIAAAQAELAELSLPLTDHHEISTSGQFVYSLPSLDDSEEMSISSVAPSTISHSLASIGGSMMSINDMPILTDVTDNSETITDNVVTDNSTINSIETVDSFAVTTESSVATDNLEVADNHAILSDDFSVTHDAVLSDNLSIQTEHEAETSEASVSVDALPSDNLEIPIDNLTIPTDNLNEISEASTVLLDNANISTDNSSTGDKFEHIADIYTDNSLPTNVETPPVAELSETLSDTVTVVSDHSSIEPIPTDNSDVMTSETLTTTDNSDLVVSDNFTTTNSESFITTTTTDSMSTSDFVQTTTDNSDFMQTTFSNSMPLLTDIDEPSTIKATEEVNEVETPEELFKMQLTDDSNSNNTDKHEVAPESVGGSFMEVDEGLCTLGGEMCSSLSEPPPEIFELPLSGAKENNFSSALGTDSSSDNSTIKTDDNVAMTDNSYTRTFTMESVIAAALETPMEHSLSTETTHGVDTLVQNAISEVGAIFSTDNDDSVEIPIQPEIVTTLESFENND